MLKKLATLVVAAIAAVGIVACGCSSSATTYADCGMVSGITDDHVITVETQTGNQFSFRDNDGDWEVGDLCTMILDNQGTPNDVRDDVITSTRYSGWVSPEEWVE